MYDSSNVKLSYKNKKKQWLVWHKITEKKISTYPNFLLADVVPRVEREEVDWEGSTLAQFGRQ